MKYLITLICLAIPAYLIRFSLFGIPSTALEVLIYLVFIYGLIIDFRAIFKSTKTFWPPLAVLLLGLIFSIYISPNREIALGQAKAFFFDPILVFILTITFLKKRDLIYLFGGLIGAATIVSAYSIFEKIADHVTSDGRVIGLFGYSPNYVALFLAPIIVLASCYLLAIIGYNKRKLSLSISGWLIVAINLYALYLSGSRGGALAVAAGLFFFAIIYYWKEIRKRLWLKMSIVIFILIVVSSAAWFFRPDFNTLNSRVASSNNIRWQIWTASIKLAKAHPYFGVGLGNFQNSFSAFTKKMQNYPEYITPEAVSPHNIFLMFYLTTGILGLIAFFWLLYLFYEQGVKNFNLVEAKIILALITTLILHGLIDGAYFKNDLSIVFWLGFAAIMLLEQKEKSN